MVASKQAATGRERIAQMQAEEARRGKRNKMYALIAGLLAVVLIAVGIFWMSSQNSSKKADAGDSQISDTSYLTAMQTIPASTFDKVGVGAAQADFTPVAGGTAATQDGKPRVLYVGAEFCPYCAMERWALVAALSRFGEFKGLTPALSSPDEGSISDIPTASFLRSTYSSKYIAFKSYETTDRLQSKELQKLSAEDEKTFQINNPKGSIPYLNWGGTSTSSTAYNDPSMAGKKGTDIAAMLKTADSETAQMIIGAANIQTAKICQLTKNQPSTVCDSAGVKAAAAKL